MTDETVGAIGNRIRALREEADLSQEELGAALVQVGYKSLGQGAISHIENGRKAPTPAGLVAFARYFNTSIDYLLGLTDNQLSAADIEEELAAGGIGGRFERVMARLSPARREQIIDYADYLASLDRELEDRADNFRHVQAALNVLERLFPPSTMELLWTQLAAAYPSLTDSLGTPVALEQKRVNEG